MWAFFFGTRFVSPQPICFPKAPDFKVVLVELADDKGSHVILMYDINKAHRWIPVLQSEWGRQACQGDRRIAPHN